MRPTAFRVGKNMLLSNAIIRPVGNERILISILFWHRHRWQSPPCRLKLRRRELIQPHNMLLTAVLLLCSVTMPIFLTQRDAKLTQPNIVVQALADPYGARMLLVLYREIARLMCLHPIRRSSEIRSYR